MKLSTRFSVAYSQIYLEDFTSKFHDHGDLWNDDNFRKMLVVGETFLIIGTVSSLSVPFFMEVLTEQPDIDTNEWNHVNICSFNVSKGLLVSGDYDDESQMLNVVLRDGKYGAYICYSSLDTISEGDLSGKDAYHVFLWPIEELFEIRVLKQWER